MSNEVSSVQVENWLVAESPVEKIYEERNIPLDDYTRQALRYTNAMIKLTDLINERWTHGNNNTMPTMKELRKDILELGGNK